MPNLSNRYLAALGELSQFQCAVQSSEQLTHVLTGVQVAPGTADTEAPDQCTLRLTFTGGHSVQVMARRYLELQLAEDAAHTMHAFGSEGSGEIHSRAARRWAQLSSQYELAG